MKFGMWTTPPAAFQLLLLPCPCRTPVLLLPNCHPAPSQILTQLLARSCPLSVLIYPAQLCSWHAPGLLLAYSCPFFIIIIIISSILQLFIGKARAAFYGNIIPYRVTALKEKFTKLSNKPKHHLVQEID